MEIRNFYQTSICVVQSWSLSACYHCLLAITVMLLCICFCFCCGFVNNSFVKVLLFAFVPFAVFAQQ